MAEQGQVSPSGSGNPRQEALLQLQNDEQRQLLDTIKELKHLGLEKHHIDLPQLVVVGDQSSGKSSVLDAISRIRFPSKGGTCTTFATELIMRTEPLWRGTVTILPGQCSPAVAERLKGFHESCSSPEDVPALIGKAKACIQRDRPKDVTEVFDHTLRIEIFGPDIPPLDLVDLPGLIHSSEKVGSNDKELINSLVHKYISNPRAIIMTILSAAYERNCQVALDIAEKADPECRRTFGVITKPDAAIDHTCKTTYLSFAKGTDKRFKQEWHVLKNRDDEAQENYSANERDLDEEQFFAQGDWATVPKERVGAAALRARLSYLLYKKVLDGLDDVKSDVKSILATKIADLARLGPPRPEDQKEFVHQLSQRFLRNAWEALRQVKPRSYTQQDHSSEIDPRNLLAAIEKANSEFSRTMLERGHKWEIVRSKSGLAAEASEQDILPQPVLLEEYLRNIVQPCMKNNSYGVPTGSVNPAVYRDLFLKQSQSWRRLALDHLDKTSEIVETWITIMVDDVASGDLQLANALADYLVDRKLREKVKTMRQTFELIISPYEEAYLITYDPSFIANIVALKESRINLYMGETLSTNAGAFATGKGAQELRSLDWVKSKVPIDMLPCYEVSDCVGQHYELARRHFVDNVANLVIQGTLLKDLPEIFCPDVVWSMTSEEVAEIASEDDFAIKRRRELNDDIEHLSSALELFKARPNRRRLALPQTANESTRRDLLEANVKARSPEIAAPNMAKHSEISQEISNLWEPATPPSARKIPQRDSVERSLSPQSARSDMSGQSLASAASIKTSGTTSPASSATSFGPERRGQTEGVSMRSGSPTPAGKDTEYGGKV